MPLSTYPLTNNSPWLVLQDGRAGTDSQATGLADAMKLSYSFHSLKDLSWEYYLPPTAIRNYVAEKLFGSFTSQPAGMIGSGRRASYGLLAARHHWPQITTIQIQNPRIPPQHFSHVITPEHDGLAGENVITTLGGLHRVNDAKLAHAHAQWHAKLSGYAQPRVAVLIGGNNKYVRLHSDWVDDLIAKCYALLDGGMSIWMTVSRRTPEVLRERLRAAFPDSARVWFWDGVGENPYLGFLAYADRILVTADSVSMISEALATRAPVSLLRMTGAGAKFDRFYDAIFARGLADWYDGGWIARPDGAPEAPPREPLRETERVAGLLSRI